MSVSKTVKNRLKSLSSHKYLTHVLASICEHFLIISAARRAFLHGGLALIMLVLDKKDLVSGPSTFEGLISFLGLTCVRLKSFLKAEIFLARVTSASHLGKARKNANKQATMGFRFTFDCIVD